MDETRDTEQNPTAGTAWRVGDCTVDPATNEVTRTGMTVHLEPRSMEVLVHLIRHAGKVVPRDDLQSAIWGEVVVGDESLTNAIIKIRKAFGDNARDPRYVETIPKRGYRLIAPVEPLRASPARTRRNAASFRPRRLRIPIAGGALLVIAGLAAFTMARLLGPAPAPQVEISAPTRVLVRPFVSLGADGTRAYLARGLEETVVDRLSAEPNLIVTRMSGNNGTKAEFILEGLVQPGAERLRVTIRLLDGRDGAILTNEILDQPLADLVRMEREIETRIASALALDIADADLARRAAGYTDSTAAFDLFLRARAALLTRTREGNRHARALYQQAIAHDPRFARAYGGLALSLAAEYRNGWAADPAAALAEALDMADTALGIAPDLPEQYWVIGYVHTQRRDFAAARKALKAALSLRPGYADAHALLAGIATYAGEPERSVPLLRRAMQLRPQAGYLYFLLLGRAYYFLNNCPQAEINLTEAIRRNAGNVEAHLYHAACLLRLDRADDAEWEIEEARAIEPDITLDGFFRSYPMTDREQLARLRGDLEMAGLE